MLSPSCSQEVWCCPSSCGPIWYQPVDRFLSSVWPRLLDLALLGKWLTVPSSVARFVVEELLPGLLDLEFCGVNRFRLVNIYNTSCLYFCILTNVTCASCDSGFPLWLQLCRRRWITPQFPSPGSELIAACHTLALVGGKCVIQNHSIFIYFFCIKLDDHLLSVSAERGFAAAWLHKETAARRRPPHTPHCRTTNTGQNLYSKYLC